MDDRASQPPIKGATAAVVLAIADNESKRSALKRRTTPASRHATAGRRSCHEEFAIAVPAVKTGTCDENRG
ncbi:MAG: hypothetical protein DCC67_09030 [Planctomycetota bacterium]|nr:MAG: hypothetical protein DCC67_09030 [Planctomycetota bacterium]